MRDQIVDKPMARKPIRVPRIDQPSECRLMPFVGDEGRARSEGFAAARPKAYLPCRKFRTAVLVKKHTA